MTRRIISTMLTITIAMIPVRLGVAAEVVELRVHGRYLIAPATVRIVVIIEPDAANRTLHVEMDGDPIFRASSVTLQGASERRVHEIHFRDVPAGQYRIFAAVLSASDVRGTATHEIDVLGRAPDERR